MILDEKLKSEIIERLRSKGAILPCQRCGKAEFTIMDGFFLTPITKELINNVIIGGPSIPTALITCNNCGNINHHAIGALGLSLPKNQK